MTKPCVYVETTIPSFYQEERTTPDIVVRREWTRRWWDGAFERYELVTSVAVLDELASGTQERVVKRLALVRDLPLLPVELAVSEIVQAYIRHKLMPADPGGDALHLALVSYHKCDFLVTWNCQHLAFLCFCVYGFLYFCKYGLGGCSFFLQASKPTYPLKLPRNHLLVGYTYH